MPQQREDFNVATELRAVQTLDLGHRKGGVRVCALDVQPDGSQHLAVHAPVGPKEHHRMASRHKAAKRCLVDVAHEAVCCQVLGADLRVIESPCRRHKHNLQQLHKH